MTFFLTRDTIGCPQVYTEGRFDRYKVRKKNLSWTMGDQGGLGEADYLYILETNLGFEMEEVYMNERQYH